MKKYEKIMEVSGLKYFLDRSKNVRTALYEGIRLVLNKREEDKLGLYMSSFLSLANPNFQEMTDYLAKDTKGLINPYRRLNEILQGASLYYFSDKLKIKNNKFTQDFLESTLDSIERSYLELPHTIKSLFNK